MSNLPYECTLYNLKTNQYFRRRLVDAIANKINNHRRHYNPVPHSDAPKTKKCNNNSLVFDASACTPRNARVCFAFEYLNNSRFECINDSGKKAHNRSIVIIYPRMYNRCVHGFYEAHCNHR